MKVRRQTCAPLGECWEYQFTWFSLKCPESPEPNKPAIPSRIQSAFSMNLKVPAFSSSSALGSSMRDTAVCAPLEGAEFFSFQAASTKCCVLSLQTFFRQLLPYLGRHKTIFSQWTLEHKLTKLGDLWETTDSIFAPEFLSNTLKVGWPNLGSHGRLMGWSFLQNFIEVPPKTWGPEDNQPGYSFLPPECFSNEFEASCAPKWFCLGLFQPGMEKSVLS